MVEPQEQVQAQEQIILLPLSVKDILDRYDVNALLTRALPEQSPSDTNTNTNKNNLNNYKVVEDKIKNNIVEDVTNKNEETNKRKLTIFQKLQCYFRSNFLNKTN